MKYDDVTHPAPAALRPSRRTVTRAAAWTVPVVAAATAAPAYAASCAPVQITIRNVDYGTLRRVSSKSWTVAFDPDGNGTKPNNVLTVDATYDKDMSVRDDAGTTNGGTNDNFTIQSQVGGLGTYGLVMAQRPTLDTPTAPLAASGHYKYTFSKPVSRLTFTLTDIDSATGDFIDSVVLTPGFTFSIPSTSLVQGRGTTAEPFRPSSANAPADNTNSAAGNVTITYPGPISTFTIDYRNAATSFATNVDQDQVVTIANFAFDYQPC